MWSNSHLHLINAAQHTFYLAPKPPCVGLSACLEACAGGTCGKAGMLGKQQRGEQTQSKRQEMDKDIRLTCSGKEGKGQNE